MLKLTGIALCIGAVFLLFCLIHKGCSKKQEQKYNRTIEKINGKHRQKVMKLDGQINDLQELVKKEVAKQGMPVPDSIIVQKIKFLTVTHPEKPVHVRQQQRPDTALRKLREQREILLQIEKKKVLGQLRPLHRREILPVLTSTQNYSGAMSHGQ